eukprot:2235877-Prymnesium_polylepis.1
MQSSLPLRLRFAEAYNFARGGGVRVSQCGYSGVLVALRRQSRSFLVTVLSTAAAFSLDVHRTVSY